MHTAQRSIRLEMAKNTFAIMTVDKFGSPLHLNADTYTWNARVKLAKIESDYFPFPNIPHA